jgi:hypothetical protein
VTEILSFYCFGCQIIFHSANNLRKRKRKKKEKEKKKKKRKKKNKRGHKRN